MLAQSSLILNSNQHYIERNQQFEINKPIGKPQFQFFKRKGKSVSIFINKSPRMGHLGSVAVKQGHSGVRSLPVFALVVVAPQKINFILDQIDSEI